MEKHYIYYFTNANDEIIYVGRTNNMNRRMNQHFGKRGHLSEEAYNEVEFIYYSDELPRNEIAIYEIYYISKWKPKHNVTYNDDSALQITLPQLKFRAFGYFRAKHSRIEELVQSELEQYKAEVKARLEELEGFWLPRIELNGLREEEEKSNPYVVEYNEDWIRMTKGKFERTFEEIKNL